MKTRRWWIPFLAMVRLQTAVIARYPVNFGMGLVVSFFGVLVLALAVTVFSPPGAGMTSDVGAMFYGYLFYLFLSDCLWRLGYSVRQEQVQGLMESLYLTPAPKFGGLLARVLPVFGLTFTAAVPALLLAGLLFGRLPFHNPLLALGLLLFSLSGLVGLGFCFAAYSLVAGDSASIAANFLEFVLMVLCALVFPFRALPEGIRWISGLIPISYCVDAFRSALLGFPAGYPELASFEVEAAVVMVFGVAMPLIGYFVYRAVVRRLREKGKLGQY